jgi:Fe-S oxidoreductase
MPATSTRRAGENELYRPIYRSEILRRIYFKYIKKESPAVHGDIEINWDTVARLIELAYRCNLCRRCAQTCPIGVDNGLLSREIRKIASHGDGHRPKELHDDGSVLQLKVGSSTGMTPMVVKDNIEFIDEDTTEKHRHRPSRRRGTRRAPTSCSSTTPARSWPGRRIPAPSPPSSRRPA